MSGITLKNLKPNANNNDYDSFFTTYYEQVNSTNNDIEFSHKNLIFANNASGKTTLAKLINHNYTSAFDYDNGHAILFNADFVNNNVDLHRQDATNSLPIITISNENKTNLTLKEKLENRINKLVNNIKRFENDTLQDENNIQRFQKTIDETLVKTTEEFRQLNIISGQYKNNFKKYSPDDSHYLKESITDEKVAYFKNDYGEINLDGFRYRFKQFNQFMNIVLPKIEELLETVIEISHENVAEEIIKYVKNNQQFFEIGKKLYNPNDKSCPFCGSKETIVERMIELKAIFNSDFEKQQTDLKLQLEMCSVHYVFTNPSLQDGLNNLGNIDSTMQEYINKFRGERIFYVILNSIKDIETSITSKLRDLSKVVVIYKENIDILKKAQAELKISFANLEQQADKYNKKISEKQTVKKKYQEEITNHCYYKVYNETKDYQDTINNLTSKIADEEFITEFNNQVKEFWQKKANRISPTKIAISEMNDYLLMFYADFKIEQNIDDTSGLSMVVIRNTDNKLAQFKTLSEGEKNILALSYFFTKIDSLFDQKNSNPKNYNDYILLVDDPITSFDDSRIASLKIKLKNLIAQNFNAVFIFTHSYTLYGELAYDDSFTCFECAKNNKQFIIKKLGGKDRNISYYRMLTKNLYIKNNSYYKLNALRQLQEFFALNFEIDKTEFIKLILPKDVNIEEIKDLLNYGSHGSSDKQFMFTQSGNFSDDKYNKLINSIIKNLKKQVFKIIS